MKVNSHQTGSVIDPAIVDPRDWPIADSRSVCIFEAINLVGAARYGSEWTGHELSAVWWNPSADREREASFSHSHSPAPMNIGEGVPGRPVSSLDRKRASQINMTIEQWRLRQGENDAARAEAMVAWRLNKAVFHRLERASDWLFEQCRNGVVKGRFRLRTGGALYPMESFDWNTENPLVTFVSEGGNQQRVGGHLSQLQKVYVFIDQADLIAAMATLARTPIAISTVDLAELSPYLQLAVKLALANNYTSADRDETQDIREAEVRRIWKDALPDTPMSKTAIGAIVKVMGFPDSSAILQGQRTQNRKKGTHP